VAEKMKKGTQILAEVREQAQRVERDLGAIKRALRKPLDAEIARGELTVPQAAVMHIVVGRPGISLKDLSREVSLAHSTVSGIADRLEKRGLIERRTDPADGRISRIYPTGPVTEWVRDKLPTLASEPLAKALSGASAADRAAIEQALRRLRELLDGGEKQE
jgi:MarR family transcriptional regulator, organic hydroperoxide resistance regulator